ncbi:RecQ family zinc-binding domain-containing protein [Halalkalibacter akibai]|uniref:ATP-dependent DNA helicase RecQ zinc-binding domain-containing protein n=1 Tax=Halalkalibacter akibai (strain ATCC 43226 / DSM 21942 / CIP 109018 / JCM 9157 / 1139) TaxID=1236973 RepID=W4QX39_HALA3|nr:RecQ family zinc-binding domain-containing protein [Halalkalibacter akibai]GAE35889.1 hypothetical protein JCM9157_3026 [Halalkalibacter akibai JCM 9157]
MLLERDKLTDEQLQELLHVMQKVNSFDYNAEKELVHMRGVPDVAWRTLKYQLESRGIIRKEQILPFSVESLILSIREEEQERNQIKQKNLEAFLRWIKTQGCRREKLLSYFNENLIQEIQPCCDNCGARLPQINNKGHVSSSLLPWRKTLMELFNVGESKHEETT